MRLSLLVLTYRRDAELLACLRALAPEEAAPGVEVVVGLNDDAAGNARVAALLRARHPAVRALDLPRCGRGEARNRLAAAAAGEVLHFLDDDTIPPPGFADRVLAAHARWPRASAVGGPNLGPPGAAGFPRAADFLLRSALGAGPMAVRHRPGGPEGPAPGWVFTLSNFGVRRAAFEGGLRFPGRAASGEETLFLHELERRGGVAVHAPALFVHHRRRATLAPFLRQTYSCGVGRAQITRAAPSSLFLPTLAPAACAATAALLAAARPEILAALAGVYAFAALFEAARMAWTERDPAAIALPALFPLAHAAYACGLAAGVLAGPAHDAQPRPRLPRNARAADR